MESNNDWPTGNLKEVSKDLSTRFNFPETLYVHDQGVFATKEENDKVIDAYTNWEESEEDDSIAVYQLIRVCRHKITKAHHLVDEDELAVRRKND